jgi:heat shock protein HtpX
MLRSDPCAFNDIGFEHGVPTVFDVIRSNKRRSVGLVVGVMAVVALFGALIGLLVGQVLVSVLVALAVGGALAIGSYWKADAVALRVSRAEPADPAQYQRLHNIVEGLCVAGGLPKPVVYVVEDPAPNAFATGRNPNHAAIVVTTGLLDQMNRVELEGLIAHEISHIRNYDIMVSTLAVTMVGSISLLADLAIRKMWWNGGRVSRRGDKQDSSNPLAYVGFPLLVFSPLVAKAMQATIPQRRETLADVSACQLTRYPPGLISALEKLEAATTVTHSASTATAHLWIEQPMSGVADAGRLPGIHKMFDTHPSLSERIALLREL